MRALRGFTMIEALLVIAIVVVIFAFSLEAAASIQRVSEGQGGVGAVRDALTLASERARLGVAQTPWGVYLDYDDDTREAESATVFAGPSYVLRDTTYDLLVSLRPALHVQNATLSGVLPSSGSDHEIVFSPLNAVTTQYGDVTLESSNVQTLLHISSFGTVVEP